MRVGGCEKRRVAIWRPRSAEPWDYCRSAVVAHWAWLKCVLGAVKAYVAVWGPWSLGLQVCCRGALGMA